MVLVKYPSCEKLIKTWDTYAFSRAFEKSIMDTIMKPIKIHKKLESRVSYTFTSPNYIKENDTESLQLKDKDGRDIKK